MFRPMVPPLLNIQQFCHENILRKIWVALLIFKKMVNE
jgi:hypothetical protein